jgi:hypothetical protein
MKVGPRVYLTDFSNWFDMFYIFGSLLMSILHLTTSPFLFECKAVMIFVITQSILRTFKTMRIITLYSPIVTMLENVVYDLKEFILFFIILIAMFSLTIGVLGNGNPHPTISPALAYAKAEAIEAGEGYLGIEYHDIGRLTANFIETFKISVGDFDSVIEGSSYLNNNDNIIFWIVFMMILTLTCIIFLNFVIAQASASYEKVSEELESFISKQKAKLIAESEHMFPVSMKNEENLPKYIIIR